MVEWCLWYRAAVLCRVWHIARALSWLLEHLLAMPVRLSVVRTRAMALSAVGFDRSCNPPVNAPAAHPELVTLFTSMLQKVHLLVPFGAHEELHGLSSHPGRGIVSAADIDLYMSFMERSPAHRYAAQKDVRAAQPLLQHIYAICTVPASLDMAWDIFHGHRADRALDFSQWSPTIMDAREVRYLFACLMDKSWELYVELGGHQEASWMALGPRP